eukprot:TRINITY_DN12384_c0_g2_i1.p1 TRINITY_DN12384_c0_g2~~TRINITY_DN12384_c0_g2_i1.p1  ORF type:complete len:481 (-),score=83.12 TRINITY_DN12384_c0_g2_i1:175-1617(-)
MCIRDSYKSRLNMIVAPSGNLIPVGLADYTVNKDDREISIDLQPYEIISVQDQQIIRATTEMVATYSSATMSAAFMFALFKGLAAFWNILEAMQYIQMIQYVDLHHPPNVERFIMGIGRYNFDFSLQYTDFLHTGAVDPPQRPKLIVKHEYPTTQGRFHYLDFTASFLNNCFVQVMMIKVVAVVHLIFRLLHVRNPSTKFITDVLGYLEFKVWAKILECTFLSLCVGSWLQMSNHNTRTGMNTLSTILAVPFFVWTLTAPYVFIQLALKYVRKKTAKLGVFFANFQEYSERPLFYVPISYAFKMFAITVLVVLKGAPLLQIVLMVFGFCGKAVWVTIYKPHVSERTNTLSLATDISLALLFSILAGILLVEHLGFYDTGAQISHARLSVGWWLMGGISLLLITQFVYFMLDTIPLVWGYMKLAYNWILEKAGKRKPNVSDQEIFIEDEMSALKSGTLKRTSTIGTEMDADKKMKQTNIVF